MILTKPLGTGAVLKADMVGEGKAAWLHVSGVVRGRGESEEETRL